MLQTREGQLASPAPTVCPSQDSFSSQVEVVIIVNTSEHLVFTLLYPSVSWASFGVTSEHSRDLEHSRAVICRG